jgi:hypothetical protein
MQLLEIWRQLWIWCRIFTPSPTHNFTVTLPLSAEPAEPQVHIIITIELKLWKRKKNYFCSIDFHHTVTIYSDYRWGLDWWKDLLTTLTHNSELQAITAPPLISTIHKSAQHPLSLFQTAMSSLAIPWQRLLIVEILKIHAPKYSLQTPIQNWLGQLNCLPYNSSAWTMQKHPISNSTSIVACRFIVVETCLQNLLVLNGYWMRSLQQSNVGWVSENKVLRKMLRCKTRWDIKLI